MNIHWILLPIIAVVNLILGLLALIRDRKNQTNLAFFAMTIFLSAWLLIGGYVTNLFPAFLPNLTLWMRVTMALAALMAASGLYLSFVFPKKHVSLQWYKKLWLVLGGVLALVTALTPLIEEKVYIDNGQIMTIEPSGIIIYMLWSVGTILILTVILIKNFIKSRGLERNQFKYLIFGIVTFGTIGIITNLVIPTITHSNRLLNYGLYCTLVFSSCVSYAIVKHRMMDIRLLALKSVAYTLSLATVAGIYIAFYYLLIERFYEFNFLNFFILLVLVLTFQPVSRFFENITDKIFARGRYDFKQLLCELNDIARNNSRSLTDLSEAVIDTLISQMRISKAAFVLTDCNGANPIRISGFITKSKSFFNEPSLLAAKAEDMVVYNELSSEKQKAILRKKGIEVIVPLKTENRIEGAIVLGEKSSGDVYSAQDLNLLELASSQIAITLENARLFEQAITDSLTGLFHHRFFHIQLNNEVEKAKRFAYPLSLIMLDIDYFKEINDNYGHQTGDKVLLELTDIIRKNVRSFDIVGRYGGDEFIILLPVINKNGVFNHRKMVEKIANRILDVIAKHKFTKKGLKLTASMGVAVFSGSGNVSPHALIDKVDNLLYGAKNSGRNTTFLQVFETEDILKPA
ncbi:MAG: diguanylate cyclase [Actinobacteria bacterium]|nr:MAG: diguanylate cyclase [Actinomycetota bacterium]